MANRLLKQHPIPDVVSIHLPAPTENPGKPDEFGFVFLADGTAAPFYTSLDDTLTRLWQHSPPDQFKPTPIASLLNGLVAQIQKGAVTFTINNYSQLSPAPFLITWLGTSGKNILALRGIVDSFDI